MSSRGETSNKEGVEESSLMLQAMQQQFERMNVDEFEDEKDQASLNHESGVCAKAKGVVEVFKSSKMARWD
ncbi:hypothetical protein AAG906_006797 [Vitis piasezkii]